MKRCLRCETTFGDGPWVCPSCGWTPAFVNGVRAFAPDLVDGVDGEGGFEADAFDRLARLEERSFWFGARNDLIGWALDRYAPSATSFLEIGCGTGFVLEAIGRMRPGMGLVGSELFPAGLAYAAQRLPNAELVQMDARQLPYTAEFDAVGAFDVLEHVDRDRQALSECHRALAPAGTLLVTVPQHPWLWSNADDYAHHVRRYTRRELRAKLEQAGFELRHVTSFVSLLLPAMALSRVRERRS